MTAPTITAPAGAPAQSRRTPTVVDVARTLLGILERTHHITGRLHTNPGATGVALLTLGEVNVWVYPHEVRWDSGHRDPRTGRPSCVTMPHTNLALVAAQVAARYKLQAGTAATTGQR